MYTKKIIYSNKRDKNASEQEIELQNIASKYNFTPIIHKTLFTDTYCEITMDKIDTICLADMYGDKATDLPIHIWSKIHHIIETLYEEEGIEYIDITPYNFIEHKNKLYIIDFGDAYYKDTKPRNWFHKDFLKNPYGWNPDFL